MDKKVIKRVGREADSRNFVILLCVVLAGMATGMGLDVLSTRTDVFGSWPNATQGIASSIVGGLVAFVTAFITVELTGGRDRRLSDLRAARDQVATLMRLVMVEAVDFSAPKRTLGAEIQVARRLTAELLVSVSYVAQFDSELALRLYDLGGKLTDKVVSWPDDDTDPSYLELDDGWESRTDDLLDLIGELPHDLSLFLIKNPPL